MIRRYHVLVLPLLVAVVGATSQAPAPKPAEGKPSTAGSKPPPKKAGPQSAGLNVDDVVRMLEAKVPEAIVLQQIRGAGKKFEFAPDDLIRLKKAGASDALLLEMSAASSASSAPAAEPAKEPTASPTPLGAAPAPAPEPPPPLPPVASPAAPVETPKVPPKKRLAVEEFDYSAVKSQVQAIFRTEQNIGKGIRALFTHRLTQGGQLTVVERAKLEAVAREQDLGASGRAKPGTGARIGRIRGADAILMGDIVAFGRDDRRTGAKAGGFIPWVGPIVAGVSRWTRSEKAVVVVTYRLVDSETSEVLQTGEARGESVRKSKGWGGLAGALGSGVAGVEVDMTSANFAETIIGEATIDCVNKLAELVTQQVSNLPPKKVEVEARVADVSGASVTITAGSDAGVQVGDRFTIERVVKEVLDPVTKEVLDLQTRLIGELVVTSVRERISVGAFSGPEAAQLKDIARKK